MKYRFKAMDKKRQADQLDSPLVLADPRGWVAVFVVLITACFIGVWAFLGSIPNATTATGVLGYEGGVTTVQAPVSGTVAELAVHAGDLVPPHAGVARIRSANGTAVTVNSERGGRVIAANSRPGSVVSPGDWLVQLETGYAESAPLHADLLVDAATVPTIRVGQPVLITVPGVSSRTYGLLRGRIASLGQFPVSPEQVRSILGSDASVTTNAVPPTYVSVELEQSTRTRSGYAWTSQAGPDRPLASRTPITAEVQLGTVTPIVALLGG